MVDPITLVAFFCGFMTCLVLCMAHISKTYSDAKTSLDEAISHEDRAQKYFEHCKKMQAAMDKMGKNTKEQNDE